MADDPTRVSDRWLFADGTTLPVIAGGDDSDPPADPPAKDGKDGDKPTPKGGDEPLGEGGKKALDNERKARRDAEAKLKDLEAKLQEIEDKDKSEVDRLREENETLKTKSSDMELKAARFEVAMTKGLSAAQAKRLVGATVEELEADADEILETFGTPKPDGDPKPPSRKPVADLKGGTDPTNDPTEMDPRKLAEHIPRP